VEYLDSTRQVALGLLSCAFFWAVAAEREPAAADMLDVYILTGQSNSLGTTGDTQNPDQSIGADPADLEVRFWWDNTAADPPTPGWNSGDTITFLQEQQGGIFPNYNAAGLQQSHWGPEIAFGRALHAAGQDDFMIIKASRGGGGNTHWSKSAGGLMYQHVVDTVLSATTAIQDAGDTFQIRGLLYLQGESDSSFEAEMAGIRFQQLLDNLTLDLPNAGNMFAVLGGIAAASPTRDIVRQRQAALAASDDRIDYFENLDLQDRLYDGLHFDKSAKLTVGARYAVAVLNRVEPPNGIAGDVNQDGILSGDGTGPAETDDISAFIQGWRADTSRLTNLNRVLHGDLNLSGLTDLADAFLLHQALSDQGSAFPFQRLPEPSTASLALIFAVLLWRHRNTSAES
jgi:hypothetical protein